MNTIFTQIGSYKKDFILNLNFGWVTNLMISIEEVIINHKKVTDNSLVLIKFFLEKEINS